MSSRTEDPRFYGWFLHTDRLDALFARDLRTTVTGRMRWWASCRYGDKLALYNRALDEWLEAHVVQSLELAVLRETLTVGQLVWVEAPFHWSDVAGERHAAARGADVRCSFHGTVDGPSGKEVRVEGTFNPHRVTCSTANVELRGVRTQFVLGSVAELCGCTVTLRPIAIGERMLRPRSAWSAPAEFWQQVHPSEVDQFASVDWDRTVSEADLRVLKAIPEREVKEILARLLGEDVVPNDWGGEHYDLWTTRLSIAGRRHSAAFILKGPAAFRPMTIAVLGRNGDQIERLSHSPAQVLVVQHCHQITEQVVSMLRAYASVHANYRRYMVIDGYDTLRILASAGVV